MNDIKDQLLNPVFLGLGVFALTSFLLLLWKQMSLGKQRKLNSLLSAQNDQMKDDLEQADSKYDQLLSLYESEGRKVQEMLESSKVTARNLDDSQDKFLQLETAMKELHAFETRLEQFRHDIEDLNKQSKNISDIAFQSQLLSFNASVEAARAGESGEGFANVAEDLSKLSTMSEKTAKDVLKGLNFSLVGSEELLEDMARMIESMDPLMQELNLSIEQVSHHVSDAGKVVTDTHIG